jgi:hypothetical protein
MPSNLHRCCSFVLILLSVVMFCVPVRAGTTGSLSGTLVDAQSGTPIPGATITVASPSQIAKATTDAHGRYVFVSLAPDEYTITVEKDGYDSVSLAGVAVFADAAQVVSLKTNKSLKTIARVTSRSAGDLVHPGTTADLYSVSAAQQERTAVLGGGGDLNSAYSAIAAVPGAYVPTNQNGYLQAIHVRGGDSDEVGYEFDGVPVNRAFDNYPSGSFSSLGQLELQVYTGASPAGAEGQGLAGFVNQVIKTGTYPGSFTADGTVGGPAYYHSLNVEAGGASPDRTFSYYVGIGGFDQQHRYIDQWNGNSLESEFGEPLGACPTGVTNMPASCYSDGAPNVSAGEAPGYVLAPIPFGLETSGVSDRSTVLNFHFAIPHKNSALRDDIQLLYDNDSIASQLYSSPNDEGLSNIAALNEGCGYDCATPYYLDSYTYTGAEGAPFTSADLGSITPYYFPSSSTNRAMYADLPLNGEDTSYNNQVIIKAQYQHNFSDDAFLRIYGYTYYSNWFATGAASSFQNYVGYDSGDYEIGSHTRGISASFDDQLSPEHLLSVEASYVTATSLRMNNLTSFNESSFGSYADNFAVLVNPNAVMSGTCYALPASGTAATATSCGTGNVVAVNNPAAFASLYASAAAGAPATAAGQSLSGYTCGGAPCELYTVGNGETGDYNDVTPNFYGYSVTDLWRPNDKVVVNAGVRLDTYQYVGGDTLDGAARAFWFNAFNLDTCYDASTLQLVDKSTLETGTFNPQTACSSFNNTTNTYEAATMYNTNATYTYNEVQPRVGATWTLTPQTVLRASAGKYIEEPSAAYEQYNSLNSDLPDALADFYSLGWNTPNHEVSPPESYNFDFSYERQFKGTDMSVKVTPFLRLTNDQIENFYINIKQGFISGLNAGNQTSDGFEFAFTKGNFDRDGFAAQLGFTYTYASLKFSTLPNGSTILSPINADIATYNAYTKSCSPGGADYGKNQFGQPLCGATPTGVADAPCYLNGAASSCTAAGAIANPYWNAPAQPLLNPTAAYLPYTVIPGGIGTGVEAYNYPYVSTLILQYKHKKLAVSPSLQFVAGNRYGAPETTPGIDPATCGALAGSTSPSLGRNPYSNAAGAAYDASTCTGTITIPDPYTGQFDGIGAFRQPAQLLGHVRISYDINPHLTATVTMANLLSTCFGGQHTAFTYYWSNQTCSYGAVMDGLISPVGNDYNPGDNVQTALRYPYEPSFGTYNDISSSELNPFSIYFDLKVKL